MTEVLDPMVGFHWVLSAYVCGAACIKPSPFTGPVTFSQIMNDRPDKCRFAIAQRVPLRLDKSWSAGLFMTGDPTGPFVVWDLFDDELVRGKRTGPSGLMSPPPAWFLCDSEDGAIMKAQALYDRETSDG